MERSIQGRIIKVKAISKKFHNVFRFTRRTAEITLPSGESHAFDRHVLETGPAVSVLPYFYDKKRKEWQVVLVDQYRPAVQVMSLEAPGGLLKTKNDPRSEMARELYEEAGLKVNPKEIEVVGIHHLASSFCDQEVVLGAVRLKTRSREEFFERVRRHNGLVSEREFTEVVVVPISQALDHPTLIKYTLAKFQIYDLARRLKYFQKESKTA